MPITPENLGRAKELHDELYKRLGKLVDSGVAPDDPSYLKLSNGYNTVRKGLDQYEAGQRKVDDAGKLLSAPTETRTPAMAGPPPADEKGSYNFHFEPSVTEIQNMLHADPSLAQRMGIGWVFDPATEEHSEPVADPTSGATIGENRVPAKTHLDLLEAGSGDYNAAAEYLWKQRHQEATDKGEAVQRYKHVKLGDQPLQYLTGGAEYNINRRLAPAALGAADAYSMGQASPLLDAGRDLAEYELGKRGIDTDWLPAHSKDIEARSPGLYMAGNMLAYGAPGNPTNLLQEGLANAAKYGAVDAAGKAVRGPGMKALISAGTGAVANTVEGGARDFSRNLGEGKNPLDAAGAALREMPLNVVAGGAGGGLADVIGQTAGSVRQSFREQPKMRNLKVLQDAGGDSDPIRGVVAPPEVKDFVRQANTAGAVGSPGAFAAEEVAPHIQRNMEKRATDEQALIEQQKQEYFQHPAYSGQTISGEPAIRGLVDMAQQGWTAGPVTGAPRNMNPGQVEKLGKVIREYTDNPMIVRRQDAQAFADQWGGIVIDGELGNRLYGLSPDRAASPGHSIVAVPLRMNAEKLTGLEKRIDEELNMAATRGSNNDPVWTDFNRSVKKMRDQFPYYVDEAGNLVPPPEPPQSAKPDGPVYDGEFVDTPRPREPGTDIEGPMPPSEEPPSGGGSPPGGGSGPTMPGIGPGGPRYVAPEDATPMSLMAGGQLPELPAGRSEPMSAPEAPQPRNQGQELLDRISSPSFPVGPRYQDFARELAFLQDHPRVTGATRQEVESLAANHDLRNNEYEHLHDALYPDNNRQPKQDQFSKLYSEAQASAPPSDVSADEIMSVAPGGDRMDVRADELMSAQPKADLADAIKSATASNSGLADVAGVVKAMGGDVEAAHKAILEAEQRGAIELRPEGGLNRLSPEELSLTIPGPHKTRLSLIRVVDPEAIATPKQSLPPEVREPTERLVRPQDDRGALERSLDAQLGDPDISLPGPLAKDWAESNAETKDWYEDIVGPGRDPRSDEAKRLADLTEQQQAHSEAMGQVRNMEERLGPLSDKSHLKSILGMMSKKLGREITEEDLIRAGIITGGVAAAATSDDKDKQDAGLGAMALGGFGGRRGGGGRRSGPPGGPTSIIDELKAPKGPRQLEAFLENGERVEGFSALRHKQHEALNALETSKSRVGAGGDKTIRDRVMRFNQGDDKLYDDALLQEAKNVGKEKELRNAAAAAVYPHLKERVWGLGGEGFRRALADAGGMRSDKVLELLSGSERNAFARQPDTLLGEMQRAFLEDPARRLFNLTGGRVGARYGDDIRRAYEQLFPDQDQPQKDR